MVITEELGNVVRLGGFEVPDLSHELPVEERVWFTVVLGAGSFAVRAYSEDYAIFKAEIRSQELRRSTIPIEIGAGLPLVIPMVPSEAASHAAAMFNNKSEAELMGLYESPGPVNAIEATIPTPPYNPNQVRLFDPYKFQ